MENSALQINEKDNVIIAIRPVTKGQAVVVDGKELFKATDDVEAGHKIALTSISSGGNVFRYGEPIVQATRDIGPGEWVHVHNTKPIPGALEE